MLCLQKQVDFRRLNSTDDNEQAQFECGDISVSVVSLKDLDISSLTNSSVTYCPQNKGWTAYVHVRWSVDDFSSTMT